MKMLKGWKTGWRWISMQMMALALAVQGAWLTLPPNLVSHISDSTKTLVVVALLVMGIIGRMVDQDADKG